MQVFCADNQDSSKSSPSVDYDHDYDYDYDYDYNSTSFNLSTTTTAETISSAESAPPLEGCSGNGSSASRRSIENLKPQFNLSFFVSLGEESVGKDMSLVQFRKGLEGEVVLSLAIKGEALKLRHSRVVLQSQVPVESSCFFVSIRQMYWKNKVIVPQYRTSLKPFFSSSWSFISRTMQERLFWKLKMIVLKSTTV